MGQIRSDQVRDSHISNLPTPGRGRRPGGVDRGEQERDWEGGMSDWMGVGNGGMDRWDDQ